MPRKKKVIRDTQVYKLPEYGATVTVEYDTANPPPFWQPGPGVVIVGEHECEPKPRFTAADFAGDPPEQSRRTDPPRGGNIRLLPAEELERRREGLLAGPAPPGTAAVPYTSEDEMNRMFGTNLKPGELDANTMAMAAGESVIPSGE